MQRWQNSHILHRSPELRPVKTLTKEKRKKSQEKNKALENRIMKVLIEGKSKHDPNVLSGKTEGGKTVNIKAPKELIGKMVDVRITEAKTWSLYGELI